MLHTLEIQNGLAELPPPQGEPTREQVMRKYPRICAHIICESLGYACPSTAASILRDAMYHRKNYCEFIASCYRGDARECVRRAVAYRHTHSGYMAEYKLALAIVLRALKTGKEPMLASWM